MTTMKRLLPMLIPAIGFLTADLASACSVCFGDPESPMAKGAVAGVLVLGGVVGSVLLGVVGTGLFWVHRGRRLGRSSEAESEGRT